MDDERTGDDPVADEAPTTPVPLQVPPGLMTAANAQPLIQKRIY